MTPRGRRVLILTVASSLALLSLVTGYGESLLETPKWTYESNQDAALLGNSVAGAGDVDNDGFDDVIIGAYSLDNDEINEGMVFVFHGSESGLSELPDWTAESNLPNTQFGFSVASAGDVNNDNHDDVIIGAPLFTDDQSLEGRAFLYLGSPSGLELTPAWTAEGDQQDAFFGSCVAGAGDVNNDGYDDVIIGAFSYTNGEEDEGRAYIYMGSESGLADTASWMAEGNQEVAAFGVCVASAGDVNNDGFDDILVGASGYDNPEDSEGRAFMYLGSESGPEETAAWETEIDQDSANYGFSLASAGDVNGDMFSDVIVGAYRFDSDQTDVGAAYLYLGSAAGLSDSASWVVVCESGLAEFGASVATAGDVNDDGFDDVLVGAPAYDMERIEGAGAHFRGVDPGAAFLYMGSDSGLSVTPECFALGEGQFTYLGNSVASAGDVDRDGLSDIVIGASRHDGPETDEGKAYAYWRTASDAPLPGFSTDSGTLRILFHQPNPSKSRATITYSLSGRERVVLTVHDIRGRQVAGITKGMLDPGIHMIEWVHGERMSPGVYFGRLTAGRDVETVKIVVAE